MFRDREALPKELATLQALIKHGGVACPPGLRTGFHIFLSYRRKNAADARSLKQALERKGYRIFMDLDPGGLGAGKFQEQLEEVLFDVPVVVMHCSAQPAGEFARIQNEGDWVRLEIRTALEQHKLLLPVATGDTDIGQLFADLPADVAGLRAMNCIDLPQSHYDSAITKVHQVRRHCAHVMWLNRGDSDLHAVFHGAVH